MSQIKWKTTITYIMAQTFLKILYKREGLTIKAFTFRLEGGAQGSKKNTVMTKAPSTNN
jgi:hypothetical protein